MNTGNSNRKRTRAIIIALAACVVIAFAVLLRDVFTPVLIALALAYIFEPVINQMERRQVRRGMAIVVLYVVLAIIIAVGVMTLGPLIARQTVKLYRFASRTVREHGAELFLGPEAESAENTEALLEEYVALLEGDTDEDGSTTNEVAEPALTRPVEPAPGAAGREAEEGIKGLLDDRVASLNQLIRENAGVLASRAGAIVYGAASHILSGVTSLLTFAVNFILVLVYTVFLMLGFPKFKRTIRRYLPAQYKDEILDILHQIDGSVSDFFRGRLLICLIAGSAASLGLWISHVDYWLLLGMGSGILSIVPFIGVVITFALSCVFAALGAQPVASLIGVCVTFGVVQWVIEPVIGTIVLSKGVKMHPVAILLALFIGGKLLGVFGVLLSIPLASVVWILFKQLLLPSMKELAGHDDEEGRDRRYEER